MSLSKGTKPDTLWVLDPKISAIIRRAAHNLSRTAGFTASDRLDIEQEFRLHILEKAAKFDSTRGQRHTFAERIIKNKANSMRRAATRQMRDSCRKKSIDAVTETVDGTATCLAQTIDDSDRQRHTGQRVQSVAELMQLRLDLSEATKGLPPELREMAALLSHISPFAAAQVMGISRRQAALHVVTLRECYEMRGLVA